MFVYIYELKYIDNTTTQDYKTFCFSESHCNIISLHIDVADMIFGFFFSFPSPRNLLFNMLNYSSLFINTTRIPSKPSNFTRLYTYCFRETRR